MLIIILGLIFGTFGVAWGHHLVHKYRLLNISIVWKYHKEHHGRNDTENKRRAKYIMPVYALISMARYANILKWTIFDWALAGICILEPTVGAVYLIAIFLGENVGYLDHTVKGYPINFTHWFTNKFGVDSGMHAQHHGKKTLYEVHTEVAFGMLCAYGWLLVCLGLYPFLLLSRKKATIEGAYLFGFRQNMANYKALEGVSLVPLLRRMPSVFDRPSLLIQYVLIVFRKEQVEGRLVEATRPKDITYTHAVSKCRNIYTMGYIPKTKAPVLLFGDEVIEGHHRDKAGLTNLTYYRVV